MVKSIAVAVLACVALRAQAVPVAGAYVEARTASVYAGPCHYGGESTTTGRDAEAVWHFTSGDFHGVSLAGLTAIAAISGSNSLGDAAGDRRWRLYIDARASQPQAAAIEGLVKERFAANLGRCAGVGRVAIAFSGSGETFVVTSPGLTRLEVESMPNHECCRQPHNVWYGPLVPIIDRKVGFTKASGFAQGSPSGPWQRGGLNSAFYGTFRL